MFSIAIDGPAGAGKTTVSKEVAKRLGAVYVDTGAMYRAIGLEFANAGFTANEVRRCFHAAANPEDKFDKYFKMIHDLPQVTFDHNAAGEQRTFCNGKDVTDYIRTPEISMMASVVSAIPGVREHLLHMQRAAAEQSDVVMEGRDIGTVVLPNADVKIFMTASVYARALRRRRELNEKGQKNSLADVMKDISIRDAQDSQRDAAPLKAADDAYTLDTSNMTFEEVVARVVTIVQHKQKTGEYPPKKRFVVSFVATGGITIEAENEADALRIFSLAETQEKAYTELAQNEISFTGIKTAPNE